MNKGQIGVQMMMLKEEIAERGIYPALEKLAQLGFHAAEVSQIDMTPENVQTLARAQRELGVRVAAMSCGLEDISRDYKYPGDTLRSDMEKIIADCRAVGCSILRIGMLPMSYASSPERMLEMADICEEYARQLKLHGIDLYYHAHNMELGGQTYPDAHARTHAAYGLRAGQPLDVARRRGPGSLSAQLRGPRPAAASEGLPHRPCAGYAKGAVRPCVRADRAVCRGGTCPQSSTRGWKAAANIFSLSRTIATVGTCGNPCAFPGTI